MLKLSENSPLLDSSGAPVYFKRPSSKYPEGVLLTRKLAADTFAIVIQFGAIAAVAILYWRQLLAMLLGLLGRNPSGLALLRNLLIAFLPAAVVGLALSRWIDTLFSVAVVLLAQIVGAVLMVAVEKWRARTPAPAALPELDPAALTPVQSLTIGLCQCLALWPGMSRSMTTIVGGYFVGLAPKRAAEFSFLLGLVTLTAATAYKSLQSGHAMLTVFGWHNIALGCVVAALTAALSVRFLVTFLSRHGLLPFALYRIALAAVLALLLARGII